MRRIRPDADLGNADWTKQTRDFVNDDRSDEERARDLGISVEDLRRLPSYTLPERRREEDE